VTGTVRELMRKRRTSQEEGVPQGQPDDDPVESLITQIQRRPKGDPIRASLEAELRRAQARQAKKASGIVRGLV
jgi:hypothetical protein